MKFMISSIFNKNDALDYTSNCDVFRASVRT